MFANTDIALCFTPQRKPQEGYRCKDVNYSCFSKISPILGKEWGHICIGNDPILINPILIDPILIDPMLIDPILIDPVLIDPILIDPILIDPILIDPSI